jgi:hypothetical protein
MAVKLLSELWLDGCIMARKAARIASAVAIVRGGASGAAVRRDIAIPAWIKILRLALSNDRLWKWSQAGVGQ